MSRKRRSRRALINSVISLILCFSMLLGTTFAWFTDEVQTGMNTIVAGDLDVELYANGNKVDSTTELFNNVEKWEPGVVAYENLQVKNEGSLALKYQMTLNVGNENHLKGRRLSEVLKVVAIDKVADNATREQVMKDAQKEVAAYKASDSNATLANFCVEGQIAAGDSNDEKTVVIFWEPNDNAIDNLYNVNNGESASDMADHLHIDFGVNLVATQMEAESDSFGKDYDEGAGLPEFELSKGVISDIVTQAITPDADGKVAQPLIFDGDHSKAKIPDGVKLADGAQQLTFSVKTMEESGSNLTVGTNEVMKSVDVHVDGVAEDNTTPMLITLDKYLPTGLNSTSVQMYHVEDGVTVDMTQVQAPELPDEHNEYSYDSATGDVTLALASFSEVVAVADTNNTWDGSVAEAFASGDGREATPYLIANAQQMAYFRNQVDGGETFEGKFIKLNSDIDLCGMNFDPIGWGYENSAHNRDGADGRVFMGTFDGNNKTIYNLYQNGWDLETSTKDYTYTNCGFGLFASVSGGTIKNLTISGADIRVECVEAGILVGLSQGNCTYENINIYDSKIANYQRPAGGVVGEVSGGGTHIFKDVTVSSDVVVGSMWGDFDTPVGGVIGARWDDTDATKVHMENVTVVCKLDVYNDVTSTYEWYAYRRAGMLIGNTDTPPADGKHSATATADFLTCKNVLVHYGNWADYHYCQFTNHNKSWPWVRIEKGENCEAYSNPRYGVPKDPVTGKTVKSIDHNHIDGDGHNVEIPFNQLYGGGQGIYGATEHLGVTIAKYSITYIYNGNVLGVRYIADNTDAISTADTNAQSAAVAAVGSGYAFNGWMNAGSTMVANIDEGNTTDIVLYPSFSNVYTATFVDQDGNVIAQGTYTNRKGSDVKTLGTRTKDKLPMIEDFEFEYWNVHVTGDNNKVTKTKLDSYSFTDKKDITIYPVYKYSGNLRLTPVDEDSDGEIDYYVVESVSDLSDPVNVPGKVNGVSVRIVKKLTDSKWDDTKTINLGEGIEVLENESLAGTPSLSAVLLPSTLTSINEEAFSSNVLGLANKKITFTYNGSKADWDKVNKESRWDAGLADNSKVICSDGVYTLTRKWTDYTWNWKAN